MFIMFILVEGNGSLACITARKRSLQRLHFYTCLSVILFTGGTWVARGACMAVGHAWYGACVAGGMHGEGACMTGGAWQGACVAGGMHGRGVCMAGGMCDRGMHGRTHMPPSRHYEIQSMSGWYSFYWNAFFFRFDTFISFSKEVDSSLRPAS